VRTAAVVFGILAALMTGIIVLFTVGETAAIAAFLAVLGVAVYSAAAAGDRFARGFARVAVVALVAGTAFAGWQGTLILKAVTGTQGQTVSADPETLAAAQAKIQDVIAGGEFRLELSEEEIEAIVQDALPDDSPLSRVTVTVVDGAGGRPGELHFVGEFKQSSLQALGVATARIRGGAVEVSLDSIEIGLVNLPGIATTAMGDLVNSVADLNTALATTEARVESVHIGDGRIVIVGTRL
jgi:hypothetical protein